MVIQFEKYQGTGNDFIMIDNREKNFNANELAISELCDRKFGIGADGVIVIENHESLDFNMIYFNPDGSQSFCGNGSRCAVAFAKTLGMIGDETNFLSTDGAHYAKMNHGLVELKMHDVTQVEKNVPHYIINTGSPHYMLFVQDVDAIDILPEAKSIRYSDRFKDEGINVNFVEPNGDGIRIRTYERGVENETLSCGTGVTAAVLADALRKEAPEGVYQTNVESQGGQLSVKFTFSNEGFSEIFLIGPAEKTFSGNIVI